MNEEAATRSSRRASALWTPLLFALVSVLPGCGLIARQATIAYIAVDEHVSPKHIEIELNNRLAAPALIEVRERVPWADPSDKDVKVEDAQSVPPWEKVETPVDGELVKGLRRWRVTVPPGQTMKLTAQFAIRMPADKMLVGGNRRN